MLEKETDTVYIIRSIRHAKMHVKNVLNPFQWLKLQLEQKNVIEIDTSNEEDSNFDFHHDHQVQTVGLIAAKHRQAARKRIINEAMARRFQERLNHA